MGQPDGDSGEAPIKILVVAYSYGGRTPRLKLLSCAVFSIVISVALAIPMTSSAQSTHDADVRDLQRLETVWNEAHERGDVDALKALWADDIEVAVPKMPVMTKADVLKFARSGRMTFLSYRTSDIKVRAYGNAAVVTGRLQRTRIINGNGQEISDDWRFTKTYIRESQKWRVVAFHASEAAQPVTTALRLQINNTREIDELLGFVSTSFVGLTPQVSHGFSRSGEAAAVALEGEGCTAEGGTYPGGAASNSQSLAKLAISLIVGSGIASRFPWIKFNLLETLDPRSNCLGTFIIQPGDTLVMRCLTS